jgi:hypothetical protein
MEHERTTLWDDQPVALQGAVAAVVKTAKTPVFHSALTRAFETFGAEANMP